ncbi:MAG TPA: ABC transporter permease, partial [Longimicrobiales bacterium]|nr:ABC transporter permease [Longimicrobiales bacterium]
MAMGIRGVWLKIRALVARDRAERELNDEVRFHLEMEMEANIRSGMSAHDARREAYVRFGGVDRFTEQTREVRGTGWIDDLVRDMRQGFRSLRHSPAFAGAAVLTIALGVGATTAVFSVVQGVLLRPLPFPEPDRLVSVWLNNPRQGIEEDITSYPNFRDWREQSRTLDHVVGVATTLRSLTGEGEPEEVPAAIVTGGFFEMLGVQPALGRGFRPEEVETESGGQVVVLSHELWTRRFGADPGVIGRTILLSGAAHEVVGVTPPGLRYPQEAELWVPLTFEGRADLRDARGVLWLPVLGRLAPGTSLPEAQSEMSALAARLAEAFPGENEGTGIKLELLHETLVGDARIPLLILVGAVGLVLLIGAANVANLLLARGAARGREMALRLALGAGRARLARQVLTESTLLGLIGGALGTLLALAGVGLFVRLAPADLPRIDGVTVDLPVLAFALLVALATSVLFGVAPALQAGRSQAADNLRAGGRSGSDGGLSRLRAVFVATQFALALVLLVGSGLLVRSFVNLQAVDPGFEPEGVLSFRIGLPGSRYEDYDAVRAFYDGLLPDLASIPGVEGAAAVSNVFLSRLPDMAGVTIESRPELETAENPVAYDGATSAFIDVLGMRLVAGRGFELTDERGSPPVAIVNELFVRTFLPNQDPVGERFLFGNPTGDDPPWITIVGVVEDAQRWGLGQPLRPYAFRPMPQFLDRAVDVLVRTTGRPAAYAAAAREVVARHDPDLPVTNLRTLDRAIADSLAQQRFLVLLLAVFAASATVLAAVGIYGVMAYLVGRRTREIGIRVAMGASRGTVVGGVLRDALVQVMGGLAAGLLGAWVLTRFMRSQLFGLEPSDPATFVGVSVLLVVV